MKQFFKKIFPGSRVPGSGKNITRIAGEISAKRSTVASYPAVLYLEATSVCNLRCPMCPTTMDFPEYRYPVKFFEVGLIDRLEHVLPYVRRCFLSGGGEPLLHPELFTIIGRVKSHGIEVIFNCNATLLDEQRSRALIDSGVDCISFSVDGATPETYQAIRTPARLEAVLENIARLSELKRTQGRERPFLNLQYTLLDLNQNEVRAIVPLAAGLGINHVVIEPLTPVFCFNDDYKKYYELHSVPAAAIRDEIEAAKGDAQKAGLLLTSHYLENESEEAGGRICIQPWLTFGVRVDGRVFACCGTPEQMGHLRESTFEEIWNGPQYRALREAASLGQFPKFCKLCLDENRCNRFNEDLLKG